jgi:peptidoglycan/xylan/chitin deacetylase (PgdA/CDA1 family)
MRELAKRILSVSGYYRHLRRLRSSRSPVHLILMYHDIGSDEDSNSMASVIRDRLSKSQFEAHLRAIRDAARVLTVEDAVDEILKLDGLQEDTVSITFDDGYLSVYDQAYPLLRKYSLPATVYLTTDWINGKMELWWEELADMFAASELSYDARREIGRVIGIEPASLDVRGTDLIRDKMSVHETVASELRQFEDHTVKSAISELADILGFDLQQREASRHLMWEHIKEMADDCMTFGSHTCSHLNIRHVPVEKLENEIAESKKEIEEKIGSVVKGFAYPYGQDVAAYKKVTPIFEKSGIAYACTASPGTNQMGSNLYTLARETLPSTRSRALLHREICLDFVDVR